MATGQGEQANASVGSETGTPYFCRSPPHLSVYFACIASVLYPSLEKLGSFSLKR